MQVVKNDINPLKIQIEGDYWDSKIYKGRLYLWNFDNEIIIVNWDMLIERIIETHEKKYSFVIESAFKNSDNLYIKESAAMINREAFKYNLNELCNKNFFISEQDLNQYIIQKIRSPFTELPIDTEIYSNTFYSILDSGLWKIRFDDESDNIFNDSKPKKLWDCSMLSLKVRSGGRICLSAGNDGLYEYDINPQNYYRNNSNIIPMGDNVRKLSEKHSLFSNWIYSSIYSSSDIEESSMFGFRWKKDSRELEYVGSYSKEQIFKNADKTKMSWANDDKIYSVTSTEIEIVKFIQSHLNNYNTDAFEQMDTFKIDITGDIINASTGLFGNVIECEDELIIIQSNNEIYYVNDQITKWNIFPRSIRYENQLHIIKNDVLEVYSINSDLFVNQEKKIFGTKRYFNKKQTQDWG